MGTLKNMTGVFLEVDSSFSRGNGRGYIFSKELGNVTVKQSIIPDTNGKWFRFDCYWDSQVSVISDEECGSTQIERTKGCFVVTSEVQNVKSELGYEKECRDNGRTIAKFTGSGLVLEVYPSHMYLWHSHVGVILHVKAEGAKKDLDEIFVPLQPISFKAVALSCPNRFVSFSATNVRAHSRYRPCDLFFAQNVKIGENDGHFIAKTQDGKNIILLDDHFSLVKEKPKNSDSEWSIAYFKVFSKTKKVVYLSAFLTDEDEFNDVFESLIGNRGSEDPFEDSSSFESSCSEIDGSAFFRNLKMWDIDDDPLDWYTHEDVDVVNKMSQVSVNSNSSVPYRAASVSAARTPSPKVAEELWHSSIRNVPQPTMAPPPNPPASSSLAGSSKEPSISPNSNNFWPAYDKNRDSKDESATLGNTRSVSHSMKSLLFSKPSEKSVNQLLSNKVSDKNMDLRRTTVEPTNRTYDENEDLSFRDESSFLKSPSTFNEPIDENNLGRLNNQLRAISCVIRKGYKNATKAQIEKENQLRNKDRTDFRGSCVGLQPSRTGHEMTSTMKQASEGSSDHFNLSIESHQTHSSSSASPLRNDRSDPSERTERWAVQSTTSNISTNWKEKKREDFPNAMNRYKTSDVNSVRFMEDKYKNLTKRLINEKSAEYVDRAFCKLDTIETRTIRLVLYSIATDSATRCAVRAFSRDVVILLIHAVYSPEEPFFVYDLQRTGVNLRDIEDSEPFALLTCVERHIFDIIRMEQSLWNYIIQSLQFIQELSLPGC